MPPRVAFLLHTQPLFEFHFCSPLDRIFFCLCFRETLHLKCYMRQIMKFLHLEVCFKQIKVINSTFNMLLSKVRAQNFKLYPFISNMVFYREPVRVTHRASRLNFRVPTTTVKRLRSAPIFSHFVLYILQSIMTAHLPMISFAGW